MKDVTDKLIERLRASRATWKDAKSVPTDLELEAIERILADAKIIKAAEELAEVAEACLRMMDDVIRGSGKGDMAIKPDHSMSVIDGWKRFTAYRAAVSERVDDPHTCNACRGGYNRADAGGYAVNVLAQMPVGDNSAGA